MSIAAILGALTMSEEIKAQLENSDHLLLIYLSSFHNEKNGRRSHKQCWPSFAALQAATNLSERQIPTSIKRLEDLGLIEVFRNSGQGRQARRSNLYVLKFPFMYGAEAAPESCTDYTLMVQPVQTNKEKKKELEKTPVGLSPDELSNAVSVIWDSAHKVGKGRSSKLKLESEIKRAHARKHALADIVRGALGYLNSREAAKDNHQFEKGTHLVIKGDFFEAWIQDGPENLDLGVPIAGRDLDLDRWDETRQRRSMESFSKFGGWNPENGPRPGEPGCPISDEIQREFGEKPWADKIAKPAAVNLDEEVLD